MKPATLTITWPCAYCATVGTYEMEYRHGYALPDMQYPAGWKLGPEGPYCPGHRLVVEDVPTRAAVPAREDVPPPGSPKIAPGDYIVTGLPARYARYWRVTQAGTAWGLSCWSSRWTYMSFGRPASELPPARWTPDVERVGARLVGEEPESFKVGDRVRFRGGCVVETVSAVDPDGTVQLVGGRTWFSASDLERA